MYKMTDKCWTHVYFVSTMAMEIILGLYILSFLLHQNIIPSCLISNEGQSSFAASYSAFFGNIGYSYGEFFVALFLLGFFTTQVCTACKKMKCCK
jgi:hypothetical protein